MWPEHASDQSAAAEPEALSPLSRDRVSRVVRDCKCHDGTDVYTLDWYSCAPYSGMWQGRVCLCVVCRIVVCAQDFRDAGQLAAE